MMASLRAQGLLREAEDGFDASGDSLVVVAGVYLQLYVSQPGWMLRQPDQFLDALMEKTLEVGPSC